MKLILLLGFSSKYNTGDDLQRRNGGEACRNWGMLKMDITELHWNKLLLFLEHRLLGRSDSRARKHYRKSEEDLNQFFILKYMIRSFMQLLATSNNLTF